MFDGLYFYRIKPSINIKKWALFILWGKITGSSCGLWAKDNYPFNNWKDSLNICKLLTLGVEVSGNDNIGSNIQELINVFAFTACVYSVFSNVFSENPSFLEDNPIILLPPLVCPLKLPDSWPLKIGIKKSFHIYTMYNIYVFCLTTIKEILSAKCRKETRIQYNTGRPALHGQYLLVHLALLSIIPPGILYALSNPRKSFFAGVCEDI